MTDEVAVWAPAKVNLGLEVLHRRPDGYHEVRTVLQTIRLADRLSVRVGGSPGVSLVVRSLVGSAEDLGPDERNLAVRAAREYLGVREELIGVSLELEKRIPVGAGLGGGSADAAAVLQGLSVAVGPLHDRPEVHRSRVHAIAAALGSDVPFFLEGGTQLGSGRGEILHPITPWPGRPLVVAYPNVSLPTSSIYSDLTIPLTPPGPLATMGTREFSRSFWTEAYRDLRNDLQEVVVARAPVVGELLDELEALGAEFVRVTGSGSAVFGLASSVREAARWAQRFRSKGCWARATSPARSGCRVL